MEESAGAERLRERLLLIKQAKQLGITYVGIRNEELKATIEAKKAGMISSEMGTQMLEVEKKSREIEAEKEGSVSSAAGRIQKEKKKKKRIGRKG